VKKTRACEEKGIRRNVIDRAVKVPFGRQGAGWEIACTALFLISNEKFYVNAHGLFVDHFGGIARG
jgi:NAD(P)-dependent dehydrogenase (short-subunit alcohol dehydrogenase family)